MTKLNIILIYNNNYKTTEPHASQIFFMNACPFPEKGHRLSLRIFPFSHVVMHTIDIYLIRTSLRLYHQRSCIVLNCLINV